MPLKLLNPATRLKVIIDQTLMLVAPDFIQHSAAPGIPKGIPGLKATAQMIRAGFPDFDLPIDDAIAEGDRVVLRLTEKGQF